MTKQRRVALLIESSRSYGRGVLRGIARYAHSQGTWALRHHEMMIDADPPDWLKRWDGDGVIARIESEKMVRVIRRLKIPIVDVRCRRNLRGVPRVETDDRKVVQLAIDHLRERGLRQFAFCGFSKTNYSTNRLQFMREILSEEDLQPLVYESPSAGAGNTPGAELSGMLDQKGVVQWLRELPTPCGMLASNDIRAQQVMEACRSAGMRVPDQIALIGVDNDDVICPLCDPPLSSVEPDTEGVGYTAASLLDAMMRGERISCEPTYVPPLRVVCRRSTEMTTIDDPEVAQAYYYVRDSVSNGINVVDLVRAVGISRRALERRMAKELRMTPHQLIASFRLKRLQELLQDTNLPMHQVAALAGFDYTENMHLFFRRHTGTTPGRYRDMAH